MKKNSTKVNIVLNIIRVGINAVVPVIIFPYVSKILGPDNMGKISFVNSINNYFCLFAGLGIPTYGVLACSRVKNNTEQLRKTVMELIYINFCLSILLSMIYILCINYWAALDSYRQLLYIYLLIIFFNSAGVEWLYVALEQFSYITIRTFIFKVLSLLLILVLVKNRDDYIIYSWILVLTTVITGIVNLFHIRKYIKFYNPFCLEYLKHLSPIFSFFSATLAGTISANIDTVMLGFWCSDYWVGIYSFSVKIKVLLVTIISGIVSAILPGLTRDYNNDRVEEYKITLRKMYILLLVISIGIVFFVFSESLDIILFLGGKEYLKGKSAMLILSICVIVMAITYTFGVGVLQATGNEKQYAKSMYISCTANVLLNILLIPGIGVDGAALATLISEIINSVLFMNKSDKIIGRCCRNPGTVKICVSAIIASIFIYLVRFCFSETPIICRIIVLFTIYFAIYVPVLILFHDEIRTYIRNFVYFRTKRGSL